MLNESQRALSGGASGGSVCFGVLIKRTFDGDAKLSGGFRGRYELAFALAD